MKPLQLPLIIATIAFALGAINDAPAKDEPWGDEPNPWTLDYDDAVRDAKRHDKILLLNFMGDMKTNEDMDKIHHELLLSPEFYDYAKEHDIILVDIVVDADRKKREQYNYARKIPQQYNVDGYPVILFATPDEEALGQTGYIPGGPATYFKLFDEWRAKSGEYLRDELDKIEVAPGAELMLEKEDDASADEQESGAPAAGSNGAGFLAESQEWQNAGGKSITAAVRKVEGDNVVFVMPDGATVAYPIKNLSPDSQARIRSLPAQ